MHFGNFAYMKEISQNFSDCGLHNDKYTKFSPHKNCIVPESNPLNNLILLCICSSNLKSIRPFFERSLKIFYVWTLAEV